MSPQSRRIDSHLHVWDLKDDGHEWLSPESGELYASFLPEDAGAVLADSHIDGAILVQAANTFAHTNYLLDIVNSTPWALGAVGWIQLDDPRRAIEQLDRLGKRSGFCGVRHLAHIDPRPEFFELDSVRKTLRELNRRGIPLDIPDAWPGHLSQATALARALPELSIVIDHLGKPPRGRPDFEKWRQELAAFARSSDCGVAKVSGLRLAGTDYTTAALEPSWNTALEVFGPRRLMWGSDWPMTVPNGGYAPTLEVLLDLISRLSTAEQSDVLGGTASRIYSIT